MEHIGKVLGNLGRETHTPNLKTYEPDNTPSLEERREHLRQSLGVSSLEHAFKNFRRVAGTQDAYNSFKALAEGKTDNKLLLCYGGVGNGKTYLCEAASIALYKRGIFCRVMSMARIMRGLKNSMNKNNLTPFDVLLDRYCYAERLIIDDVGMGGSGSEWEFGQLEEIIVTRYRERLFTILTTNRDLTELPGRIVSRFADREIGGIVLNGGKDFRLLKARG